MKRRILFIAIPVVLVLLAGLYFWGPSLAPEGQPPLLELSSSNFGEFQSAFDAGTNSPRLVLLLSPT